MSTRRTAIGEPTPIQGASSVGPAFDLRATVREMLGASPSSDPVDIARDVLARIDPADTREALRQALVSIVRNEISLARMRQTANDTQAPSAHPGRPVRTHADHSRDAWRRHLDDRMPGADGWKRLREFTAADLDAAALFREGLAAANAAEADRLRGLQKALADAAVDTVGELDDDTLAELLG